jgi:Zn-dependent protease with chaperone function
VFAVAVIPILAAVFVAGLHHRVFDRLHPAVAVRLLTILSLTLALCTGLVLSACAVLVIAGLGPLPNIGHWSAAGLRSHSGIAMAPGLLAAAVVLACLSAASVRAVRSFRTLRRSESAAKALHPISGSLVIIDDEDPIAYAIGSFRHRIVVSTSMLKTLAAGERRALLAHEESHVRHRHHLYVHLATLAASANPFLWPLARTVERQVERWADEDAATAVGDRTVAARALAIAAIFAAGGPSTAGALAAARHEVPDRVRLLLSGPSRRAPLTAAALVCAVAVSWLSAAVIGFWANNVLQTAETLYTRR